VSTQALPQSVWPAAQRIAAHAPLVHDCPTGQTLPQRPQCAEAVFVFVSQPLARAPSQSARPAAQRRVHSPPAQAAAPPVVTQAAPHAPQWAKSRARSTQRPAHGVSEASHMSAHAPRRQVSAAGQALPQAPQFNRSLRRSTHAGAAPRPQVVRGAGHGSTTSMGTEGASRGAVAASIAGGADAGAPHPRRAMATTARRQERSVRIIRGG
jgi:hypothetical protein